MKAMLLAAGRGERMRPLTDHTAKPLLQAGGKSLIEHHLYKLATAGITDVVINTCWHGDKIIEQLGNGSRYGVDISYSEEQQALETAGGIAKALPLLGNKPFLLISSDVWCSFDYSLLTPLPDDSVAELLMVDNPPHHKPGDFTLKPDAYLQPGIADGATLTYAGIGIFSPCLFTELPQTKVPLRDVLLPAIEKGTVKGRYWPGDWFDIGTTDRLTNLQKHLEAPD